MSVQNIPNSINTPTFLLSVVAKIECIIKRELSESDEDLVIECVKKIPLSVCNEHSSDVILNIITNTVISELQLEHDKTNNIDTHEMMKKQLYGKSDDKHCEDKDITQNVEVNLESVFGVRDFASLVKKMKAPTSSINTAYFILDTRYRVLTNSGTTYFTWTHINNLTRRQGTINSVGNVKDVISMKLSQFRMPAVASADTPYKRISILIHEFETQSFAAHENRRYHFLGTLEDHNPAPGWVEINPCDNCDGEFKFNKPINHIDTITISLSSPLEPIIFDNDRDIGQITTYGNPTIIEFPNSHNLLDGDVVYITNYSSINPIDDYIALNGININKGLVATVTTATEITIPVDTSSLNFTIVGSASTTDASTTLNGVGTNFKSELSIGDKIFITDGGSSPSFIVKSIQSDIKLTLTEPYNGLVGVGFPIIKNNIISDNIPVYFGSKRIFFTLELTYLSS
jgi:hypothetical protein